MFGTIVIIGVLLFLPMAALGPLAKHWRSIPLVDDHDHMILMALKLV